jgi:drug/metabolite transporter (DMT)-like permease
MLIFLSAFTGLYLGDLCLYRSMMYIGPPMAILLQSLSACFTAALGAIWLGQSLTARMLAGIAVATLGAALVLTERTGSTLLPGQERPRGRRLAVGAALGFSSALLLACSFILLKIALLNGVTPIWASLIRILFASVILWSLGLVRGWTRAALNGLRNHPAILWTLLLSNFFSAAGSWLASVALHNAPVGVAATIMGLQPVLVTVMGAVWYRKAPSPLVLLGMAAAFGGIALLFPPPV